MLSHGIMLQHEILSGELETGGWLYWQNWHCQQQEACEQLCAHTETRQLEAERAQGEAHHRLAQPPPGVDGVYFRPYTHDPDTREVEECAFRWMELRCPSGHAMTPYWDATWHRVCDNCDGAWQRAAREAGLGLDLVDTCKVCDRDICNTLPTR